MKFSPAKRLRSPQTFLILTALTPFVLLAGGCNKSEPVPTTPAVSSAQDMTNKIKSVEDDPRMPADAKAKEIARIKAEAQRTP